MLLLLLLFTTTVSYHANGREHASHVHFMSREQTFC